MRIIDNKGVAALEAALTIPLICYLLFFILELIRVHDTQTALDVITTECTMEYIETSSTENFQAIIKKHLPKAKLLKDIDYTFRLYPNIASVCGENIFWPQKPEKTYIPTGKTRVVSTGHIELVDFRQPETTTKEVQVESDSQSSNGESEPKTFTTSVVGNGTAFTLTFTYKFNFSSVMVKKLFQGGYNTADESSFLLWARGIGICE